MLDKIRAGALLLAKPQVLIYVIDKHIDKGCLAEFLTFERRKIVTSSNGTRWRV